MNALVLLFAVLFIPSTPISFAKPTEPPLKGFSIDLIHRDSPMSPIYDSSITSLERDINAALRSLSRRNHFRGSLYEDEDKLVETNLNHSSGEYIMKFYIGTPPLESYGIADTGSDLTWVQCEPCARCYRQNSPIFNPQSSSTFMNVPCHSKNCSFFQYRCGRSKQCIYTYSYTGTAYTEGDLAKESIYLAPSQGGQLLSYPNLVVGCGHNNGGPIPSEISGLIGLGRGPLSLVSQLRSQLGNKFSTCLLPSSYPSGKLRFGDNPVISGQNGVASTPLIYDRSNPHFYYITLKAIKLGQTLLTINGQIGDKIVVDSGTTLTSLPSSVYHQFEGLVKRAIGVAAVQNPPNPYKLCYGRNTKLPDAVFHFTNASVVLRPVNLFRDLGPGSNMVCLAVVPTNGIPFYGNVAQMNFEVEYDLDKNMTSFAPVSSCA